MNKKARKKLQILFLIIFLGAGVFAASSFLTKPKTIDIVSSLAQISQGLNGKEPQKEKSAEILFVGDIMLDRGVESQILKQTNWKWPFLKIANEFKKAGIVFGNLEGPISDKGTKVGSIYSFRADPRVIEGLNHAGFNVLSVANNHMLDYGRAALEDTFSKLNEAGIDYTGGGLNATESGAPIIKEINGTKIAFLAYTNLCAASWKATDKKSGINCVSETDFEKIKNAIGEIKKQTDIVVVSMHAGEEYTQDITKFQNDFSKYAIDAGADLVIGHHPHVAQKYETYTSKISGQVGWIFYSLGNFIFDQSFSEETMQGLMVKVIIKNKKIQEVIPIKIQINETFQAEAKEEIKDGVMPAPTKEIAETTPQISLSSINPKQGDTVLLKISNVQNIQGSAAMFNGKKIELFKHEEKILGLIGIDAKMKARNYKLAVNFPNNNDYKIEETIKVESANFPVTALAFTPELEEQGYNATSVAETIATDDGEKIYEAMKISSDIPYFSQSFTDPLVKMENVGAFGNIRKSGNVSLQHLGVDLDAKLNTPVYAINDGVVTGVFDLVNYGKTIVVDHGLGIFSLYLHLNEFKVSEGQKVKKDEVIGLSGNTGYSIAPHLHFSIKLNGASVDPLKFIETTKLEMQD